jgi:uncharacterized protein
MSAAMDKLTQLFGVRKPVIAMLHLPGLPGRPLHDVAGGPDAIIEPVARDLDVLQEAGVDGVMFCNEKDYPYQLKVTTEQATAMAFTVGSLRSRLSIPFGVNLLWDPMATLAVARASGARFIREVLTGVYESDQGIIAPPIGDIAAYRQAIGASDVLLFDNVAPEFASALGTRTVADRAKGAEFVGMDAILISGWAAGTPMAIGDLKAAKEAVTHTPVLANTGVRAERVAEIFGIADGCIVGSSLKVDGNTWNPVDPKRAAAFMAAVRDFRAQARG